LNWSVSSFRTSLDRSRRAQLQARRVSRMSSVDLLAADLVNLLVVLPAVPQAAEDLPAAVPWAP
jgi:hypothetical protein